MSTFNPNIPTIAQFISETTPLIQGNFQKSDTSFGTDHYRFSNGTANNGFHQKVTLPDQSAAPPVSVGSQLVIYSSINGTSITYPYFSRDGLPTVFPLAPIKAMAMVQMTGAVGAQTLNQSFNITSAVRAASSITFTMTNPTRTSTYGLLFSSNIRADDAFSTGIVYSITDTQTFVVNFASSGLTATRLFNVIVLEV